MNTLGINMLTTHFSMVDDPCNFCQCEEIKKGVPFFVSGQTPTGFVDTFMFAEDWAALRTNLFPPKNHFRMLNSAVSFTVHSKDLTLNPFIHIFTIAIHIQNIDHVEMIFYKEYQKHYRISDEQIDALYKAVLLGCACSYVFASEISRYAFREGTAMTPHALGMAAFSAMHNVFTEYLFKSTSGARQKLLKRLRTFFEEHIGKSSKKRVTLYSVNEPSFIADTIAPIVNNNPFDYTICGSYTVCRHLDKSSLNIKFCYPANVRSRKGHQVKQ